MNMSGNDIKVTVIIVTWNSEAVIKQCVASVLDQKYDDLEIIIIDNNSADKSADVIRKEFPRVRLVENGQNKGFSAAVNQGLGQAGGEYVLLLNPDAIMSPGSLGAMLKFMDDHPGSGACGCKILDDAGRLMWSCFHFPDLTSEIMEISLLSRLFPGSRFFGRYLMSYWDHKSTRQVDWITGACLMLRRKALESAGLMDESFFMYSEDMDLCYRLAKNNFSVYYIADAHVRHKQGNSADQVYVRMFSQRYKSRYIFFRKHYGLLKAVLLRIVLLLAFVLKIIVLFAGWIFFRDKAAAGRKISGYLYALIGN